MFLRMMVNCNHLQMISEALADFYPGKFHGFSFLSMSVLRVLANANTLKPDQNSNFAAVRTLQRS